MGGTDNIENPGPYLHRHSKKVPYMGVLSSATSSLRQPASGVPLPDALPGGFQSREEAIKAYMAHLDAVNRPEAQEPPPEPPGPEDDGLDRSGVEPVEAKPVEAGAGPVTADDKPRAPGGLIDIFPNRNGPFVPISVPLYPMETGAEAEDLTAARTPRWRGG